MGNALEFILKLTDMLTPGMRAAAGVTDVQANAIVADLNRIGAANKNLASSNVAGKMAAEFKGLGNEISRSRDELGRFISTGKSSGGGGGILGGLGKAIGGFVGPLAAGIGLAAVTAFGSSSVQSAMQFGATKQSFSVLTGSDQKGNALAGDLNKLQQDTILGPEVFKNAQTMLGFGIATEKVLPNLKMLGDISMGNAEKMGSLTLAYSQVSAAGKLSGQDLLQFINAGWNPLNQIAKDTGQTIGELKKQMEQGGISAEMIAVAMQHATSAGGTFNGMMDKLAEEPAGKMAQLQGAFEGFKIKMGEALMPLATVGMEALNHLLQLANDVIPAITAGVSWIISGITSLLQPTGEWAKWFALIKVYLGNTISGITYVLGAVWHIVSGVIEWVAKSQILKDVFWVISKVAALGWEVIKKVADVLVWIWDNVLKPLLNTIEWVYDKVKSLLGFAGKPIEITATAGLTPDAQKALNPGGTSFSNFNAPGLLPGMGGAQVSSPLTMNQPTAPGAAKSPSIASAGRERSEAINSGGQRSITISIGKQIEKLEVHVMNAKEGADEIETAVREAMRRIVYSLNGGMAN